MPRDLYDVLGVPKTASKDDIKRAYRQKSKELHPDRNKGNADAEHRFKEVNEAYEVLSDDKKRQMYDQFGTTGGNARGPNGSAGGPFGGFDFSGFGNGGFGDIFESFFGGRAASGRRTKQRGSDLQVEVTVPFAAVIHGEERTITLEREVACETCAGSGTAPGSKMKECGECGGTGQVTRTTQSFFGMIRTNVVCPVCEGAGSVPEKPCSTCGGDGRVRKRSTVTVRIPAGIRDGQTLRIKGEGQAGFRSGTAGDLFVIIRVEDDDRFPRDGDDIRSVLTLPVLDAILGTEVDVPTVHGTARLKIHAGTQPGQIFRLKGKGLPVLSSSRHGDHFVTVEIEIPSRLSRAEAKLLEEWRRLRE